MTIDHVLTVLGMSLGAYFGTRGRMAPVERAIAELKARLHLVERRVERLEKSP